MHDILEYYVFAEVLSLVGFSLKTLKLLHIIFIKKKTSIMLIILFLCIDCINSRLKIKKKYVFKCLIIRYLQSNIL